MAGRARGCMRGELDGAVKMEKDISSERLSLLASVQNCSNNNNNIVDDEANE